MERVLRRHRYPGNGRDGPPVHRPHAALRRRVQRRRRRRGALGWPTAIADTARVSAVSDPQRPRSDTSVPRVLLVMRTRTYRAKAFLQAAQRVRVNVTVATERDQPLAQLTPGSTLALDFRNEKRARAQIASFAEQYPVDAIVGVDDDTTVLAAQLAQALNLPHNPV